MKHHFYKILTLVVLLFAVASCEKLDITNNERILVKGRVVDQNGNPLKDIPLYTEAFSKVLTSAHSDDSGTFAFTSLNVSNTPLKVLVNISHEWGNENEFIEFSSRIYTSQLANRNLLIDLGTITLGSVGTLSLYLKNESRANNLIYTISYTSKVCNLPLNGNGNNSCDRNQIESGANGPTSQNQTISLESILGSVALFEYSLNNEPKQTIEIPVTNPPTNYVFEF